MTNVFRILFLIYLAIISTLWGSDVSLDLGTGYRQDVFNWNISGGENGPNVLSELKWKDLRSLNVYAELKIYLPYQFYFRFNGDYGRICQGNNSDTDYLGDDRTQIFSLSHSKANRGELFDFSFGIAWQCAFFQERLKIAPAFGFSNHEQHLRMIHGKLILDVFDPSQEGSMRDVHNNYRAQWYGPWVGADIKFDVCKNLELFGTYEYHWASYEGTGHWNLRTDFIGDFEHTGCGNGSLAYLGGKYKISSGWDVGLLFKYQIMQLRNGTDTVFFFDFLGHEACGQTRLNQVNWRAYAILGTIGYAY